MAPVPPPGTFRLYPYANPPLPAGSYALTAAIDGLPGEVETLHAAVDVTAPRYALPPDQILSTFPPANAQGSFTSRLPQIVIRRRTLPWERSQLRADGTALDTLSVPERAGAVPRPWLALVLIAEGEGSLFSDVPVDQTVTPPVRLEGDADVPKATCLEVPETVVAKVFPAAEDLPVLCHVREVDLADTELALGDDDGWMAVVLCNRLPQPNTRYTACLINLEGQYHELPVAPEHQPTYDRRAKVVDLERFAPIAEARHSSDAAGMGLDVVDTQLKPTAPAPKKARASPGWSPIIPGGAVIPTDAALTRGSGHDLRLLGTGIGVNLPWHLFERTVRFPVLASWSFKCTEKGDFQFLANQVSSRLLGHVSSGPESPDGEPLREDAAPSGLPTEPPSVRPLPLFTATGHVATVHESRRGDRTTAWLRGALIPEPVQRAAARPDGRYPLAHHADQLRRVTPDGQEDLSYAAAFEIGRLLALSRPSVVAALNRWRRQRFAAATAGAVAARITAAAPKGLRELLEMPDPRLDAVGQLRGAGAGRRFARGLLAALGDDPAQLADPRPLADPGFAVDGVEPFTKGRDTRLARGLAIDLGAGQSGDEAERLWAAPVSVGPRDPQTDLAAARLKLEDTAGRLAAAADLLADRLGDADTDRQR